MKKILTLPTVIVFLITILVAGGCSQEPGTSPGENRGKVTIYLKAIKIKGEKHLEMYDSNNPGTIVVDALETIVNPGDTVVWEIISSWKLKKVKKIGPKDYGVIINKDAEPISGTKNFSLIIPENATPGKEKYDIKCKNWIGSSWEIDPYLKIPH